MGGNINIDMMNAIPTEEPRPTVDPKGAATKVAKAAVQKGVTEAGQVVDTTGSVFTAAAGDIVTGSIAFVVYGATTEAISKKIEEFLNNPNNAEASEVRKIMEAIKQEVLSFIEDQEQKVRGMLDEQGYEIPEGKTTQEYLNENSEARRALVGRIVEKAVDRAVKKLGNISDKLKELVDFILGEGPKLDSKI